MLLLRSKKHHFSILLNAYSLKRIMQSIFRIPTPKTLTHTTSRDDQLRIQTLYFKTSWEIDDIILQLNLTRRQVKYALKHRFISQNHLRGHYILLNTPQRKQLIK